MSQKENSLIDNLIKGIKQPHRIAILVFTGLLYLFLNFINSTFFISKLPSFVYHWTYKMSLDILFWSLLTYSFKELCWRIEDGEYQKLLPLIIQFVAAIFIYTTSRQIKDSILNTTCGNEAVTFAKILTLVIGMLYNFFYIRISKKLRMSSLLYITVLPILAYFIIFDRFLYGSNVELSNQVCNMLKNFYFPSKMIILLKHWHISLYYIFAELFAVSGLAIFCWKITNSQIEKHQTKRIFPIVMLMSQFATLASGYVGNTVKLFPKYNMFIRFNTNIIIVLFAILVINNYWFFLKPNHVGNNIDLKPKVKEKQNDVKQNNNISLKNRILDIIKDNYIFLLIAFLTVYYGLSTVFLEQFWKKNITEFSLIEAKEKIISLTSLVNNGDANSALNILKKFDPKVNISNALSILQEKLSNGELLSNYKKIYYSDFFSKYMISQAKISFLFVIFGTNILMEKISWTMFASFTPISAIVGTIFVLGVPILAKIFKIENIFGLNIYKFVTYFGGFFIALFKSLKYSSFDPTKEQYIVSQHQEDRIKIKNIEGYTGRIGKSGGSFVLIALFSIDSLGLHYLHGGIMTFLFVSVLAMSIVWYLSVIKIGQDYDNRQIIEKHHVTKEDQHHIHHQDTKNESEKSSKNNKNNEDNKNNKNNEDNIDDNNKK